MDVSALNKHTRVTEFWSPIHVKELKYLRFAFHMLTNLFLKLNSIHNLYNTFGLYTFRLDSDNI